MQVDVAGASETAVPVLPGPEKVETPAPLVLGQLIAPSLWLAEAANALWRHVRLGEITRLITSDLENNGARPSRLDAAKLLIFCDLFCLSPAQVRQNKCCNSLRYN
ncbi:MAG: hypothetical protein JO038_05750 [Alphaproteobacteria bacterium]|nr:hypothetical protein [Alphaproteobacteria bacterium]